MKWKIQGWVRQLPNRSTTEALYRAEVVVNGYRVWYLDSEYAEALERRVEVVKGVTLAMLEDGWTPMEIREDIR